MIGKRSSLFRRSVADGEKRFVGLAAGKETLKKFCKKKDHWKGATINNDIPSWIIFFSSRKKHASLLQAKSILPPLKGLVVHAFRLIFTNC